MTTRLAIVHSIRLIGFALCAFGLAGCSSRPQSGSVSHVATRDFIWEKRIPPAGLGAYGYVVFTKKPSASELPRYESLCSSYLENLQPSADFGSTPSPSLMVTFWPLKEDRQPTQVKTLGCSYLVKDGYGYDLATLIASSIRKSGAVGPLLVAWQQPYTDKSNNSNVLVFDLSDFDNADLERGMRIWKNQISQDPELWNKGFNLIKCREAARNLIERYGDQILVLIQVKGASAEKSSH